MTLGPETASGIALSDSNSSGCTQIPPGYMNVNGYPEVHFTPQSLPFNLPIALPVVVKSTNP
jgi:hypothetical protein